MLDVQTVFYYTADIILLVLVIYSLVQVILNKQMKKMYKRLFMGVFTLQTLFLLLTLAELCVFFTSKQNTQYVVLVMLECLCMSILYDIYAAAIFLQTGFGLKKNPLYYFLCLLSIIYAIIVLIVPWTNVFYVLSDGVYTRGRLYLLLLTPMALFIVTLLAVIIRNRKKLPAYSFISYSSLMILTLLALILQYCTTSETIIYFPVIIVFVLSVILCFAEQSRTNKKQREELYHQRTNNLILQMRPHYIYNTMMSIYYLCDQNPELAKQVILNFSGYLQRNFSALSKVEPISFLEELEHTRAYLAVEKARFDDKLSVLYDIPCTTFRLPALTLQPIVENAVKHGVDPEHESIRIKISTKETNDNYLIQVIDDGAIFDPGSIKPGEALSNIRERLESSCGGDLSVSTKGVFTVVTITLPKKYQNFD